MGALPQDKRSGLLALGADTDHRVTPTPRTPRTRPGGAAADAVEEIAFVEVAARSEPRPPHPAMEGRRLREIDLSARCPRSRPATMADRPTYGRLSAPLDALSPTP